MSERIQWIKSRIKQYTQYRPSLTGDEEYKRYLARCVKLLDIDEMLTSLENSGGMSLEEEKMVLGQLEKELNKVLSK